MYPSSFWRTHGMSTGGLHLPNPTQMWEKAERTNWGAQTGAPPHSEVSRAHLDLLVEQVLGQVLERGAGPDGHPCLLVQQRDPAGVSGPVFGVEVLQGLEVIVDGVSYHDLVFQDLQDLEVSGGVKQAEQQKKQRSGIKQTIRH